MEVCTRNDGFTSLSSGFRFRAAERERKRERETIALLQTR
jgi:hypothetical protein